MKSFAIVAADEVLGDVRAAELKWLLQTATNAVTRVFDATSGRDCGRCNCCIVGRHGRVLLLLRLVNRVDGRHETCRESCGCCGCCRRGCEVSVTTSGAG